jgi:hypothetical protein
MIAANLFLYEEDKKCHEKIKLKMKLRNGMKE